METKAQLLCSALVCASLLSTTPVMAADYTLTIYAGNSAQQTLSVPTGAVTVQPSNHVWSSSASPGQFSYPAGQEVTLLATAPQGYSFVDWFESDAFSGPFGTEITNNPYSVAMSGDRTFYATFATNTSGYFNLTVYKGATGNGSITGTGDFNCPLGDISASQAYARGTVVTLTNSPAPGWQFGYWEFAGGDFTNSTFTLTMDRDQLVQAVLSRTSVAPSPTMTLTPSTITNNYTGTVELHVTGLTPGQTVRLDVFLDLTDSGVVEPEDPLDPSFLVTDGAVPQIGGETNLNIPFDRDGTTNGQITVIFPLHGDFGMDKASGHYLVRLSDPAGKFTPLMTSYRVQPALYPQGVKGTLLDSVSAKPVPGAVVALIDLSRVFGAGGSLDFSQAFLTTSAFSDNQGQFTAYCPPGYYLPLALRVGYYTVLPIDDFTALFSALIVVNPDQWSSHDGALTPGERTIAGQLSQAGSGGGLAGIPLFGIGVATNGLEFAYAFTDPQGQFQMPVGPGQWSLLLPPLALAQLGCVAVTNLPALDTTAGSVSNLDLTVPAATHLIYGQLASSTGTPLANVRIDAFSTTSTNYYTSTYTDTNGQYALGVFTGDWTVRPNAPTVDALGYEAQAVSVTVTNLPAVRTDITLEPIPKPATGALAWHWQNPLPQGNDLRGVAAGAGEFIAVGDHGTILRSGDGHQWEVENSVTNVPLNAVIYADGRFVAVGGEYTSDGDIGLVLVSTNGVNWQSVDPGPVGQLQAVTYGANRYVAVGDAGSVSSPDGVHWESGQSGPNGSYLQAVAFGNGLFVAGGNSSVILTSTNGVQWTDVLTNDAVLHCLAFGGGRFVAELGVGAPTLNVLVSTNGLDWSSAQTTVSFPATLLWDQGSFYGLGNSGKWVSSTDGVQWTEHDLPDPVNQFAFSALAATNGTLVAVGSAGTIAYSPDGATWLAASSGVQMPFTDVAFGQGEFVATGSPGAGGEILVSTNGSAWTPVYSRSDTDFPRVFYAGGMFFASGGSRDAASQDGRHWWVDDPLTAVSPMGIAYGRGQFVAVGGSGVFLSSDGLEWQAPTPGLTNALNSIAYGHGLFVAGTGSTCWASRDGAHWSATLTTGDSIEDLAFAQGRFVAVEQNGGVLVSSDGTNWMTAIVSPTGNVNRLAAGAGTFVAVGDNLSVSADGLHWQVVRTDLPLLTGVTYGNQHFVVVGANGAALSSDVLPDESPVIVTQPPSHTLAPGLPLTLSVSVRSSQPVSYQWYQDGQPIPGLDTPALRVPVVQAQNTGQYTVEISNSSGSIESKPAQIVVATNGPAIPPLQHWQPATGTPLGATGLYSIATGWSGWPAGASATTVVVGDQGTIEASVNGGAWETEYSGTTNALTGVSFGQDQFVAVGEAGTLLVSDNGTYWQPYDSGTSASLERIAFGSGLFVAVGDNGTLLTSTNGLQWTPHVSGVIGNLLGAAVGMVNTQRVVVAVGENDALLTSLDGSHWVRHDLGFTNDWLGACFGAGQFVVVGTGGALLTSPDGVTWQRRASPTQSDLWSVTAGGGFIVTVGTDGAVVTSSDGIHWAAQSSGTAAYLFEVTFANGAFWAVGDSGTLLVSDPIVHLRWQSFPDALLGLQGPAGRFYRLEATDELRSTNDWTWQSEFYVPSDSPPESAVFVPNLSGSPHRIFRAVALP